MDPINTDDILQAMNDDVYYRFLQAIELGRWPDGQRLTDEQRHTCMQAVIIYEHAHLPEQQRTGFVPPKTEPCADDSHIHTEEKPLFWKDS